MYNNPAPRAANLIKYPHSAMFILISVLLLFATALSLAILQVMRPNYRFAWLVAAGGAFLTWASVLLWQARMPLLLELPSWGSAALFANSPFFLADAVNWPYALALTTLGLAVILTAVVRENFPAPFPWAGALTLIGFGLLAVLADNPLTLVLIWTALDVTELTTQLISVEGRASERVVAGFAARAVGMGLVLWAGWVSLSRGIPFDFRSPLPEVGVYLILAAGLRLGVLPLHLAYATESAVRRGFGTTLRLVSAASSLVILARIPAQGIISPLAPFLLVLVAGAGLYGGWMWVRSPDELAGRPYWVITLASFAIAAALRGNPLGSIAWGSALVLAGSALFLSSIQHKTLQRILLVIGLWGISSLPFSPTASGWDVSANSSWAIWLTWPLLLAAQALLAAGFIRQTLRPAASVPLDAQIAWARNIYPIGIGLPLAVLILLGLFGWDGARLLGTLPAGLVAAALTATLLWLTPRLRWLNPIRAHWIRPQQGESSRLDSFYNTLWNIYRSLGRLSESVSAAFEGDGGILWALLFLVLFLSLLAPRIP
ncbi:MAG: hypothetical protein C4583_19125 [Anaerolineaceae bacterium]|nr:MAG: hypothetical protein C4583_19125 [Anaerolineaceae bacterium]